MDVFLKSRRKLLSDINLVNKETFSTTYGAVIIEDEIINLLHC